MRRSYHMQKREADRLKVRERIVRATMELHDQKGVAPTTFADIAKKAGVGQATVHRHFPTLSDLVQACGAHVWVEMKPPVPQQAAEVFVGLETTRERLRRMIEEVDNFYRRGAHRLALAARDRQLIPELDGFLTAIEAGVGALVREALAGSELGETTISRASALMSFPVWASLERIMPDRDASMEFKADLLECVLRVSRRQNDER